MSKSNELDRKAKLYLMGCIDLSDYENTGQYTDRQKIAFVYDCFLKQHCFEYNLKRLPNEVDLFADWLRGLPSVMNIEYSNFRILQLAIRWGSLPENHTEKQADRILDNYWNFIANKFLQLVRGYRVPKSEVIA